MISSPVGICNLAIGWLGGNLIISLDDDTTEANLCKANYESSRDAALEYRDWTFATSRRMLNPEVSAPEFGWSKKFLLPSDNIRVINVSDDVNFRRRMEWEKEEDRILCDKDIIYIRYIKRIVDVTKYSAGFIQAAAARLASDIAIPMTNNPKLMHSFWQLFEIKCEIAGSMEGTQGTNVIMRSDRFVRVR